MVDVQAIAGAALVRDFSTASLWEGLGVLQPFFRFQHATPTIYRLRDPNDLYQFVSLYAAGEPRHT